MRIYLDACSLQRPMDDRSQPRINVEAEAVLMILRLVELGVLELLSSEVLQFEIARIPDAQRQARSSEILKLASLDEVTQQATKILIREMGVVDALRFLSQFRAGSGDYTKDREQWLDDLSLEQIASGIKAKRRKPRRSNGRS